MGHTVPDIVRDRISKSLIGVTKGIPHTKEHSRHISESLKGRPNMRKGRTKHTDEFLMKMSKSLSGIPRLECVRKKISISTKKRYEDILEREKTSEALKKAYQNPIIRENRVKINKSRLYHSGANESIEHRNTKEKLKKQFEELGYDVKLEKFITINLKRYAIDVFAKNNKETILIEVGTCSLVKICDLQTFYSKVFQVPRYL